MNIFGQPLPNHSQIRCTTPKGDEMDLGICDKCVAKGVSLEMCNAVLEGIKEYWIYQIDDDKSLKAKQKKERKDFHNSHKIDSIKQIVNTGKRAEKDARRKGKLI
jgi:hypothetical protein